MDARSIITKLRDKTKLSAAEVEWFANGLAGGAVTDAQAGAFAMAVCLNGLGEQARVFLTEFMRDSGDVLRWNLPGPVLDKHSTGGIGDCVSILLAPALAACGAFVPMISGRGLGHTGGTLDKLEAIPGVQTQVSEDRFHQIVAKTGCAIVSASKEVAPADKRLYAIRDVTGTVESVDLITASILSKKLAAGLEGLVLDVKVGTGAFMQTPDDAKELAKSLVKTANGANCKTTALITDMNQPLAPAAGNGVEIIECMKVLEGNIDNDLSNLTAILGGELLSQAGLAPNNASGTEMILAAISDGAAAARFDRMIEMLGGPALFSECWAAVLPVAPVITKVSSDRAGTVSEIDARAIGMAVVEMGGGRLTGDDLIDPTVGLSDLVRLGAEVDSNTPLATIHAATRKDAHIAETAVRAAYFIGEKKTIRPLVYERIDA